VGRRGLSLEKYLCLREKKRKMKTHMAEVLFSLRGVGKIFSETDSQYFLDGGVTFFLRFQGERAEVEMWEKKCDGRKPVAGSMAEGGAHALF